MNKCLWQYHSLEPKNGYSIVSLKPQRQQHTEHSAITRNEFLIMMMFLGGLPMAGVNPENIMLDERTEIRKTTYGKIAFM